MMVKSSVDTSNVEFDDWPRWRSHVGGASDSIAADRRRRTVDEFPHQEPKVPPEALGIRGFGEAGQGAYSALRRRTGWCWTAEEERPPRAEKHLPRAYILGRLDRRQPVTARAARLA